MSRWLLTVAALLTCAALSVQADYLVIKLNLAAMKEKQENPQGPQQQQQFQMQQGAGGAAGPGEGGGAAGMMMMPGQGAGGGRGGMLGARGARGAAGGAAGQQGAGGMMMMPGRGRPGGGMMPAGGGAGGDGGDAGAGGPGGAMAGASGFGSLQNNPSEDDEPDSLPLICGAIIEYKRGDRGNSVDHNGMPFIKHKWGKTYLGVGLIEIEFREVKAPTALQRFELQVKTANIRETDPNKVEKYLGLAEVALADGLLDKAKAMMDKVIEVDPKHKSAVVFKKLLAEMAKPISRDDEAINWRGRLGDGFKTKSSEHYTLIYDVTSDKQVDSWLATLENNYRGFYYWFGIKGRPLPVPDKRLVAVLVSSPEGFDHQHKEIFDEVSTVTDGFFAARDNLAVFSANRRDPAFEGLQKYYPQVMARNNWNEEELLKGKIRWNAQKEIGDLDNAYAQTFALIKKAMQEEAEIAAVSHEGTRQLLAATGLLPRAVQTPEWLDFGLASFFETAKGSYWHGIGGRNSPYLVTFTLWNQNKTLEKSPAVALKSVVTDRYFEHIKEAKNKEGAETKARTMTWALVYFLMEKKPEQLKAYFDELGNLPRDLALDEDTLLTTFAKAFGLVDPAKPDAVDEHKLTLLANEWYSYLRNTSLAVPETLNVMKEDIKKAKEATEKAANPQRSNNQRQGGGVMGPGGMMGSPGGMMRPGGYGAGRGDG